MKLTLKKLSILFLLSSMTNAAENVKRYEVEAGTLKGEAVIKTSANASGGEAVGDLQKKGASVEIIVDGGSSGGSFDAKLAYACHRDMATFIRLNGEMVKVSLPSTSNWHEYQTVEFKLTLKPGENTLSLSRGGNLDYLEIQGVTSTPQEKPAEPEESNKPRKI